MTGGQARQAKKIGKIIDEIGKEVKKIGGEAVQIGKKMAKQTVSPFTKEGKLTEEAIKNSVTIFGEGYTPLKQAERLAKDHGGEAKDWFKKTTKEFTSEFGKSYQVHYYYNEKTGKIVEEKTKFSKSIK